MALLNATKISGNLYCEKLHLASNMSAIKSCGGIKKILFVAGLKSANQKHYKNMLSNDHDLDATFLHFCLVKMLEVTIFLKVSLLITLLILCVLISEGSISIKHISSCFADYKQIKPEDMDR